MIVALPRRRLGAIDPAARPTADPPAASAPPPAPPDEGFLDEVPPDIKSGFAWSIGAAVATAMLGGLAWAWHKAMKGKR